MFLSETQAQVRDMARQFADEVIRPMAEELDRDERFPAEIYDQMAELGLFGIGVPEEMGGPGFDTVTYAVVMEELSRGYASVADQCGLIELISTLLVRHGTDAQRDRWLADVRAARTLCAYCITEPEAGTGVSGIRTTAVRDGDGWVLNGAKCVVRNAGQADVLIVAARAGAGIGLFKVESGAKGLSLQDYPTIDGGRAAEIVLDGVAAVCLAEDGAGVLERVLGRGVLALCAEAVGIMDVIKDMTVEYTRTRKQFGVPIGKFQALQHRMAEMLLEVEQARSSVIKAAFHEGDAGVARERAISAAKVTIGRVGTLVTEETIQIHGGMAMTWEYPVGHFAKRLTMIGTELGDEDYHLRRYIALGRTA